jgi:hypothetical protein
LINGEIKEAKAALEFAFRTFKEFNEVFPRVIRDFQKIEPIIADELKALWQAFENFLYLLHSLAKKELDITEENFREDPVIWKELLSSMFKENIEELISLLDNLQKILKKVQIRPEKEWLSMFEYSPKYARQKENSAQYSQYKNVINKVEFKIQRFIADSIKTNGRIVEKKGISILIQTGDWKGRYHAYLPRPMNDHRIVYSWNGKIVRFEIMGTHKELGID